MLFFDDLTLSISEWIPFCQNAIETINDTLDSLKGLKDSLLTGKVDEAPESSSFDIEEVPYATSAVYPDLWLPD